MDFKSLMSNIFYWKNWHHHVKYFAISPAWVWYMARSGSPWFFTASNPTLTFGGFEGEGKKEMYEQLPEGTYPKTIYIEPKIAENVLLSHIDRREFCYPFIVKPDVGMMGFMFRKINNQAELLQYHAAMPVQYLVQALVAYPYEISAFYYRLPTEKKGTISGLLQKEPPFVIGNGRDNVKTLILKHENLNLPKQKLLAKHQHILDEIIADGEKFQISNASNRVQGGYLLGIDSEIDETLQHFFDTLSHKGQFLYGRYDIMCRSIADLKAGKNFSILEFNGAGAGTQHIYANDYSLLKAQGIILHHWKMLHKIAKENRRLGIKKWGFWQGLTHLNKAKKNLMMLKRLDAEFPVF